MRRLLATVRRTIRAVFRASIDLGRMVFAAGMALVRGFLIAAGLASELADRFGSPFGKAALKAYRACYGRDPRRTWSIVRGRVRDVYGYLPAEAHILTAALATYRPRDKQAAAEFDRITHHQPAEEAAMTSRPMTVAELDAMSEVIDLAAEIADRAEQAAIDNSFPGEGAPGSCECGSATCTGRCPECGMHETQRHGHNVHYNPDNDDTAEAVTDTVTLYDVKTNRVWRRMSTDEGERDVQVCRDLGDTVQEYETTDRAGNPLRVVLQHDATGPYADSDEGGVYEFAR